MQIHSRLHGITVALLYLFCILSPLQLNTYIWLPWSTIVGRRIDYLAFVIYLTQFILVALIILCTKLYYKNIISLLKTYKWYVILIGTVIGLNSIGAKFPLLAFSQWFLYLTIFLFLYYLLLLKPNKYFILFLLVCAGVYSASIGVLQTLSGHSLGGILYFLGERTFTLDALNIAKTSFCISWIPHLPCTNILRAYGTFPHPNVLGGFLTIITLTWIFHRHTLLQRGKNISKYFPASLRSNIPMVVWFSFTFILIVGILFTFSRSAYLAFTIGLLWIFSTYKKVNFVITIGIVASLILITLPVPFNHVFNQQFLEERRQLNTAALDIFSTNPLVGVGLKHYLVLLPQFLEEKTIFFVQPVHNIFLLVVSETGLIGIGIMFILLYSFIKNFQVKSSLYLLLPLIIIGLSDHYLLTLYQGNIILIFILFFVITQDRT